MNIKLACFKSLLHDGKALSESSQEFISSLENELHEKINLAELNDYDCDLKLIFIQTGGSEGMFLENFAQLKAPYYLLTSGGNNSLAASLEILTYLNIHGLKGEVLHGDISYIASRIRELGEVARVKKELALTRLGVFGKPSDWLISSIPSYDELKKKTGIELVDIDLHKTEENFAKIGSFTPDLKNDHFDAEELKKANKIYKSIGTIIKENHLDGFTIRCFDLLTSLHSTGCLALALFNEQGIVSACEGDIMAMVSMVLAKAVSGQSSFQANPSRIDVKNKEVIFAHCTLPLDMVKSYRCDTHFESGTGVAVKGELYEKEVTVLRVSSNLKDYFLETGTIVENLNEKNLCRTQIKVKFDGDIASLLTHPCGNHHIIFYGNHKAVLTTVLQDLLK